MAKGRSKTSPEQIEVDERHIKAVNLRKAGATYQEIADELGYSGISSAEYAVKAALKKTMSEPAEELRQLELLRLDEMQAGVYAGAIAGDPDSINTILKIMAHRMRLTGLERKDAPIYIKDFPKIESADDAVKAISGLIDRATAGQISLSDAISLATLINKHWETLSGAELLERLKQLEEQYGNEHERS